MLNHRSLTDGSFPGNPLTPLHAGWEDFPMEGVEPVLSRETGPDLVSVNDFDLDRSDANRSRPSSKGRL